MTRNMEHASVGLERIVASSLRRAPSGEGPVLAWPLACGQAVADNDVADVADLGNLELTQSERGRMVRDLNSILEHIDSLNELDTTTVPPMAQISDRFGVDESRQGSKRFAYASRDDVHEGLRKSLLHDVALANAPDTDGTFFEVPKVIER